MYFYIKLEPSKCIETPIQHLKNLEPNSSFDVRSYLSVFFIECAADDHSSDLTSSGPDFVEFGVP